jgi:hypothetical protein
MEAKEAEEGEALTMAHLELAGLLLGVATMAAVCRERGLPLAGQAVLALADNTNAVSWVRKAGARDRRAAAMVRAHGVAEATERFSALAHYLKGELNPIADYVSRHSVEDCRMFMADVPCPLRACTVPWTQVSPPASWIERVRGLLLSSTSTQR